jgi:Do/DeqQ family serine protease
MYSWRCLATGVVTVVLACATPGCQRQDRSDLAAPVVSVGAVNSVQGVESYANVVDRVTPSVVTIRSERRVRAPRMFPFFFSNPFDGGADPRGRGQERVQRGLGSGVLVTGDGQILTNHHVVDGAQEISIELSNGRRYQAKLLGSDAPSDLALLKIDSGGMPALTLGNSDAVRVGDVALAVGNPLGVGQTVTMGIISAKNRSTGLGEGSFEDFLQTDAPINQGNSGGALVNTAGQLIGINSQIVSMSGGNIGIGFAIPSNMARSVMEQLAKTGSVKRGLLGVGIQQLTPELAESLGIPGKQGVLINSVTPDSPADQAGIRRGDVIIAVNGDAVSDTNTLRNRIAGMQPGSEVTLTILRDGKEQTVKTRLAEFNSERAATAPESGGSGPARLGLSAQPVPPEIAARWRIPPNQGLLITNLDPGGAAAAAGLQPGDVLLEADRKPLRTTQDLQAVVSSNTRTLLLLVNREGQSFFVTIQPRTGAR